MQNTAQIPTPKPFDVYAIVPRTIFWHKKIAPPPLSEDEILEWADAYHEHHGKWPNKDSGAIPESPGETWSKVDGALHRGGRGLLPDSSLALLLFEKRGRRHPLYLPPFTEELILEWADAFFERTGEWPVVNSGAIPESPGDTWDVARNALAEGRRGLPGGTTLARLLTEKRGARKGYYLPPFTEEQILAWADAFFERTGDWPNSSTGEITEAPGETWNMVHSALTGGNRGLPGGSSLPQLLQERRGRRNGGCLPPFTPEQILTWADGFRERHGRWPVSNDKINPELNAIPEASGETWTIVNYALGSGLRGLPGGSSLALLLEEERGKFHRLHQSPYTLELILAWADAFFEHHGDWPVSASGPIPESPGSTWAGVDAALAKGSRGLPGGSSLFRVLEEHRGKRSRLDLVPLTERRILKWADAHHKRTGEWPILSSGPVRGCPDSTWATLNGALQRGMRGLPGGSSLAWLLAEQRGVVNIHSLPLFTEECILSWAEAHFGRTGQWPGCDSLEPIPECPGENWRKVNSALRLGLRGMPGGTTLAALLEERCGKRNLGNLYRFSENEILQWADAHHVRTGQWPSRNSGALSELPSETWGFVDVALTQGGRGLPGGSSLARLLQEQRGRRNHACLPSLSEEQILAWADAHHVRTGEWPHCNLGDVTDAPGETWTAIQSALLAGNRGLPGGASLARLLQERRGRRSSAHQRPLSVEQILVWADAHHARVGRWPECLSVGDNTVVDAPGETWGKIDQALSRGGRGLPGGTSLARLLRELRGKRYLKGLPSLTEEQILAWADAHRARTGQWPIGKLGAIPEASGETWANVNSNLGNGDRGLPGGSSLARLLHERRGKRIRSNTTPLTVPQIVAWARAHRTRTGKWPGWDSGEVVGGDGILWSTVARALGRGGRGLPGGMAFVKFLEEQCEEEGQ